MADFPEDLDYGVKMGDSLPPIGNNYNPPQQNLYKDPSVTDEQKQAA
jgi:hypothetical protein